jgi:hypothetical protein
VWRIPGRLWKRICCAQQVKSCILDGEAMKWDRELKMFRTKGHVGCMSALSGGADEALQTSSPILMFRCFAV